jgi:4-carboxymuconolactone decarboxylase
MTPHDDDRYQRGLDKLAELNPQASAEILAPLGDLGRYILEYGYGDIYSRPGLNLRERLLLTIAMLTVLGRWPQLKIHIGNGLRVGLTPGEIEEVILQSTLYAGFPTAIEAMQLLQAVLAEQEAADHIP